MIPSVAADRACPVPVTPDESGITMVRLDPQPPAVDYAVTLNLAREEANRRLGDAMLLSGYDRDRDFEAPQHVSECHADSATPGHVDYALHRGACLRVDIENGRFVFFFRNAEV